MQPNAFLLFKCMILCRPVPPEIYNNPKIPPQKTVGLRNLSNSTSGRDYNTSTSSGAGLSGMADIDEDMDEDVERSSDIGFEPNKPSEYQMDVENPIYSDQGDDGSNDFMSE